jgi:hypothetical protein
MSEELSLYGAITKFDAVDDTLLVSGILSTPAKDAAGEIIEPDAMRKALGDFLVNGTSREMHQPIAAGKPIAAHVDENGNTHVTVKVVDKGTIQKIREGVLKGFSVGGRALKRVGNRITEILLKDASLVDIPCNSECVFNIIKFDAPGDRCTDPACKNHHESAVEKCGYCKSEMEKSMSQETLKKIDDLTATVASLAKTVEKMSTAQPVPTMVDGKPVDIAKVLTDVGDLQKRVQENDTQLANRERGSIIEKMDREGRVAFKPGIGIAYTAKELGELPMDILKFAAANSPVLPMEARAIYKGEQKPGAIDPNLKGSDRVEKAWEAEYGSLAQMRSKN